MGSRARRRAAILSLAGVGAAIWALRPPPHVGHDPRFVAGNVGTVGDEESTAIGQLIEHALGTQQPDGI